MDGGSVTRWLRALKQGEPGADQLVWERYFSRLAALATGHLRRARLPGAEADAEDVASAAFENFFRGVARGRFPRLDDRDDLWQLLVLIARRKAATLAEAERRLKRGGGLVLDEAALGGPGSDGGEGQWGGHGLNDLADPGPSPEFAAEAAEAFGRLLDALGDDGLRRMALLKLEGYTNEEVRDRLGCSLRTVTIKLALIRRLWSDQGPA